MEATVAQERLVWKTASRDDKAVAQAIAEGEEIDAIHELSEAGLLDEFFVFLEELGMMKELEQLKLVGARRVLVPTIQFVLLYLLKVLFGGKSMNELPKLLFSQEGLMKLVGFNAVQIKEGVTKRGDKQRKSKPKSGPISAQCLANNICQLDREQMERLFNAMVECLARWGFFWRSRTDQAPQSQGFCGPTHQCGRGAAMEQSCSFHRWDRLPDQWPRQRSLRRL
jgi:hypothetical protein